MRVQSFIRKNGELTPVEVEISLLPGLPQISFLGLPDAALKESILRIRSAVRAQGFSLPQSAQVIVQLWPTHIRKTSRGLDLAVAAALLWETDQLERPVDLNLPILYGELSLKGHVLAPDDLDELPPEAADDVITGPTKVSLPFSTKQAAELKDLVAPDRIEASLAPMAFSPPEPRTKKLSVVTARLAELIAAGEHATLFAGPQGSGKSTLCDLIPSLLAPPDEMEFRHVSRLWKAHGRSLTWRPVVQPHHSITPLAMIGGGSSLWNGEIARAHGGVLILDELLEFKTEVQEALREPIETGVLTIARSGKIKESPARWLLLATTNLCPCGRFVPQPDQGRCKCSRPQRHRILSRLSGPFLDRFALLSFTDTWLRQEPTVEWESIRDRVRQAVEFRRMNRNQMRPNALLPSEEIEAQLSGAVRRQLETLIGTSKRRRSAVLRVARTMADLEERVQVTLPDFDEAVQWTLRSHRALDEWRD